MKKHIKEIVFLLAISVVAVLLLLLLVTIFEKMHIHVPGSREMWIGLIGAVLGGMFTLIGVIITIYKQAEQIQEEKRLDNLPILGFEVKEFHDDLSEIFFRVEYYENRINSSIRLTLNEYKECKIIEISVLNNTCVFNFTIDSCWINGKQIEKDELFLPIQRRIAMNEKVKFLLNCECDTDTNLFCLIRFAYEDMFGYKYYQDLPIEYVETEFNDISDEVTIQELEILDIKSPILRGKGETLKDRNSIKLETVAKTYNNYEVFSQEGI